MYKFSKRSQERLSTAHPDLQRLFNEVIKHRDCTILCGYRSQEEQEAAYKAGKSNARWGESKHNTSPSLAVDVMPYPIDWEDILGVYKFAAFVLETANRMGTKLKWGGNFTTIFDGPHYELEE